MKASTNASMSELPVALRICENASSYGSMRPTPDLPAPAELLLPAGSPPVPGSPGAAPCLSPGKLLRARRSACWRSSSICSPISFHCASKSSCSRSAMSRSEAALPCALSRASKAALAASIMSAIRRFRSASSFCIRLCTPSKTTRSRRRSSICARSSLLAVIASLNLIRDWCNLRSSALMHLSVDMVCSAGALCPPISLRSCSERSRRDLSRASSFSPRCFSASICLPTSLIRSRTCVSLTEATAVSFADAARASRESSALRDWLSRRSFSFCSFCLRSTASTSSAYDLRSHSMIRYLRCSSSSCAAMPVAGRAAISL
mmetsp:Transcript_35865/g.107292  ORF Transcript_35865/g.107292 Transcript_35865/m.107292 type:complete len:319 (-) Transcript_35865:13-969(-)